MVPQIPERKGVCVSQLQESGEVKNGCNAHLAYRHPFIVGSPIQFRKNSDFFFFALYWQTEYEKVKKRVTDKLVKQKEGGEAMRSEQVMLRARPVLLKKQNSIQLYITTNMEEIRKKKKIDRLDHTQVQYEK